MSTAAQRRLIKDLQRIQKEPGEEIMASPQKTNLLRWTATIQGIDGTAWEGGLFQLKLNFSQNYPNKPPNIRFISQMFHPNIYNDGRICLDMLQNQWSPIYDIWSVLTAIRSLLADPNTLSPANMIASQMFTKNKNMYEQKVREIVQKSLQNYRDQDQQLQDNQQEELIVEPRRTNQVVVDLKITIEPRALLQQNINQPINWYQIDQLQNQPMPAIFQNFINGINQLEEDNDQPQEEQEDHSQNQDGQQQNQDREQQNQEGEQQNQDREQQNQDEEQQNQEREQQNQDDEQEDNHGIQDSHEQAAEE